METRRYTEAEILALRPCYTAAQLRAAFGRDQALTLQQIADRERVPSADRLWVLWRLLPADRRRVAVERIVARAVRQYALPEPSTRAWAERWLAGDDRTAEAAARVAALAAVRATSDAANRAAAAWAERWLAGEDRTALAARVAEEAALAAAEVPLAAARAEEAEQRRQLADIRSALREARA